MKKLKAKLKKYELVVTNYAGRNDYADTIEAETKDQAADLFIDRMPRYMIERGYSDKFIVINHVKVSLIQ